MKLSHRWTLDEEAFFFLRSLSARDQRKLVLVFDGLRDRPFVEPAFIDIDADGKTLFYHFSGRYAIAYHIDHAVRMVVIQDLSENS